MYDLLSPIKACPKEIPKTIENTRIYDETRITESDDEVGVSFHTFNKNFLLTLFFIQYIFFHY